MSNHVSFNNVYHHNQDVWDRMAHENCEWSQPVTTETILAARKGQWRVKLIPSELPAGWLGEVRDMRVLCLAASGGQQAPVLAAAGADVVVLDASKEQLALDEMVAKRDNLVLRTVLGDMQDLSSFENESFDLIFHPISNLYIPNVRKVWAECFRVLRKGGKLLSSFYNPVVFVFDRSPDLAQLGLMKPAFILPYADIKDLTAEDIEKKFTKKRGLCFWSFLSGTNKWSTGSRFGAYRFR